MGLTVEREYRKQGEEQNMEEQIRNTAEKLKQLDAENVKLIDSGISLLIARQEIEKNKEKKEAVCS